MKSLTKGLTRAVAAGAALVVLLLGLPALAQTKSTPAQHVADQLKDIGSPMLKCAPDMAQWTISFTYPEDKKTAPPNAKPLPYLKRRPASVVTTKTRSIINETITDGNGARRENWYADHTQYSKLPGEPLWSQHEPAINNGSTPDPNYTPLPADGFRDVRWISPQNFAGVMDYAGQRCLLFIPGGIGDLDLTDAAKREEKLESLPTYAWISSETRLPVVVRWEGETRAFTFGAPPTAMLTLPSDLAEQIRKGQEGRAKLFLPAARPY